MWFYEGFELQSLKAFFEFDILGNMLMVNPQDDVELSLVEVKAYIII